MTMAACLTALSQVVQWPAWDSASVSLLCLLSDTVTISRLTLCPTVS